MTDYPNTPHTYLMDCQGRELLDSPKWQAFYQAYRPVIGQILKLHAERRNIAFSELEDLTQDVFLRLIRCFHMGSYTRKKGRFRNYLFILIRNLVIDHCLTRQREERRRSFVGDNNWEESTKSPMPSPAEILENADFEAEALQALFDRVFKHSRLSEKSKAIYIMLCGEGLPAGEVAAHFGISRNAVSQVKRRVNQALAAALKDRQSALHRPT